MLAFGRTLIYVVEIEIEIEKTLQLIFKLYHPDEQQMSVAFCLKTI